LIVGIALVIPTPFYGVLVGIGKRKKNIGHSGGVGNMEQKHKDGMFMGDSSERMEDIYD